MGALWQAPLCAGAHAQLSPNLIQNGSFEDQSHIDSTAWGTPKPLDRAAFLVSGDFVAGLQRRGGCRLAHPHAELQPGTRRDG
jgi:hypothetical protein